MTVKGTARKNLDKAAAQFVSKSRDEIVAMVRETLEGHQVSSTAHLYVRIQVLARKPIHPLNTNTELGSSFWICD